jgi:hypothetical protein
MMTIKLLTPEQVWDKLVSYRSNYYDGMSALYSGDHNELKRTGETQTFWRRKNKCPIHVPIASDIAATSANFLFSQEPTYTIVHEGEEEANGEQQERMEKILAHNNIASKLNEAAESCAAMGDIYLKLRWNKESTCPLLDVAQPDMSWPEYLFGELRAVHFFTEAVADPEKNNYVRIYECYTKGKIIMAIYEGTKESLGTKMKDSMLKSLGYQPEIKTPIDDLLAVHIPNIRPNRRYRSAMHGRSDLDGLRDLCDSLDEAFSSWMRDIRLAKAKLIIPAEYLRKRNTSFAQGMDETIGASGMYEFDSDVEAYVAMDINTDAAGGNAITPSQFDIRADEHLKTCTELVREILQFAGYSPQSFGINIEGAAASGTALSIRERKSAVTKNKKITYWQAPLEKILTAMVRIDYALYPDAGSDGVDSVSISFADSMGADTSTVASAVEILSRAQAASTITKIRMVHPDWSEKQVAEEVDRVKEEYGLSIDAPDMGLGDFEDPSATEDDGESEDTENQLNPEFKKVEDGEGGDE